MAIRNTRLTDTLPTQVFQAAGQEVVTVIYLCNTSGAAATVNIYCINSDDSSGAALTNQIYSELEITSNDTYVISTEKLIFDSSDEIEVEATVANAITVTVSSFAM